MMYVLLSEKHKQYIYYVGVKYMLCFCCSVQLVQWFALHAIWI